MVISEFYLWTIIKLMKKYHLGLLGIRFDSSPLVLEPRQIWKLSPTTWTTVTFLSMGRGISWQMNCTGREYALSCV